MNEQPGYSIFQGADSIHLNTSGEEEKEELEDQKRRNRELQNELENAFDDLIDDDEENETRNSSLNCESRRISKQHPTEYHHHHNAPANPKMFQRKENTSHEINHLKNLLESKMREYEHVSKLLIEERQQTDGKLNEMKKKLSLAEVEKDRANMTRQQTHELLVEAKTKISGHEDSMLKLKDKIKSLESKNTEVNTVLEHTKTMLSDAQHKYMLVERNNGITADRQVQVKQLQEQQRAKVDMMQQLIDNLQSALSDRDHEFKTLDARYKELQRSREALLIEKSETINQLAKSLEEAQRQCQNMMATPQLAQDNLRLQTKVHALEQQTDDMHRTIRSLTQKLDATNTELEIMDSVLCQADHGESSMRVSNKRQPGHSSTPMQPEEKFTKLKSELYRCMNSQKEKREEIRKLEEQLQVRCEEIKQLKNDENRALVQMNQYKEENMRLASKMNLLQTELEKSIGKEKIDAQEKQQNELTQRIAELEQTVGEWAHKCADVEEKYEHIKKMWQDDQVAKDKLKIDMEKYKFQLVDANSECDRIKQRYIDLSDQKEAFHQELLQLKSMDVHKEMLSQKDQLASLERALQYAQLKSSEMEKQLDKEKAEHEVLVKEVQHGGNVFNKKEFSSSVCTHCIDKDADLVKAELDNVQLQSACSNYLKQISSLKNDLHESTAVINDYRYKLDTTKNETDRKIDDLREQARQFQEYMKNQSTSPRLATSSPRPQQQSTSTSPMDQHTANTHPEHKVREEMAKIFAGQIKQMENQFKEEIVKFEHNLEALRDELDEKAHELKISQQDVEVLKITVLSERKKVREVLEQKDKDSKLVLDRQAELIKRLQAEIEKQEQTVQSLFAKLNETQKLQDSERQQMDSDRRSMLDREEGLIQRSKKQQEDHSKYREKMKREVVMLTRENEVLQKKCAHMEAEAIRLSENFKKIRDRMQVKLQEAVEKIQTENRAKLERLEKEYKTKLDELVNKT